MHYFRGEKNGLKQKPKGGKCVYSHIFDNIDCNYDSAICTAFYGISHRRDNIAVEWIFLYSGEIFLSGI